MQVAKYIILSILLLLAGYSLIWGPRAEFTPTKGTVVIQYWEKWTGLEGSEMEDIVNKYNQNEGRQKGIYVQYLSMANVSQKTLIATAAGTPPDVAGVWDTQLAQWASTDALEPLDDFVRNYSDYKLDANYYKSVYWDACHFNGKLYGLVSTPANIGLQYNKALFAENADALRAAGCDPTRPPRTFAEFDRYAAALDKKQGDKVFRVGFAPMEPGWYAPQLPFWFGGELFDQKTQHFTLTTPQCVAAMEWVKSYSKRLGAAALNDFRNGLGDFASINSPFITGQSVMELYGPWSANYIGLLKPSMNDPTNPAWMDANFSTLPAAQRQAVLDRHMAKPWQERQKLAQYAFAPFPSVYVDQLITPRHTVDQLTDEELIDNGVTYCCFDVLVIPAGSKHKKEAFDFIAYVNRTDVMEKLCQLHCCTSPLAHNSPTWLSNHPNAYMSVFDRLTRSPRAHHLPIIPIWPEVIDELNNVCQRISLLNQEPADALRESQDILQAKLDQFYARHPEARGTNGQ